MDVKSALLNGELEEEVMFSSLLDLKIQNFMTLSIDYSKHFMD